MTITDTDIKAVILCIVGISILARLVKSPGSSGGGGWDDSNQSDDCGGDCGGCDGGE